MDRHLRLLSQSLLTIVFALPLGGCGGPAGEPEGPSPTDPAVPSTEANPNSPASDPATTNGMGTEVTEPSKTPPTEPAVTTPDPTPTTNPAPEAKEEASSKKEEAKVEELKGPYALQFVKYDDLMKRVADKNAKFTVVDIWATWCAPCKENFPHLVEMGKKYKEKGLAVASLSFDEPTETKQVEAAKAFLAAQKAEFPNYLLDEEFGVGNEKLGINTIPAVLVFGPDGKEIKRYTMDDPDKQFTYDEVEKDIVAMLEGKPVEAEKAPTAPKSADQ